LFQKTLEIIGVLDEDLPVSSELAIDPRLYALLNEAVSENL
jgi:hypothetical protein